MGVAAIVPRPSLFLLLDPRYILLGNTYPYLRVGDGHGSRDEGWGSGFRVQGLGFGV